MWRASAQYDRTSRETTRQDLALHRTRRAVEHGSFAPLQAHARVQRLGFTVARRDGVQSFARWKWCFLYSKNYEANSALTELNLCDNKVGDAGAVALAEALKAIGCDMQS